MITHITSIIIKICKSLHRFYPGIFRGTFDVRASAITENMKIAAAYAIASLVDEDKLSPDYILPYAFDERIKDTVAAAVAQAARKDGVARI